MKIGLEESAFLSREQAPRFNAPVIRDLNRWPRVERASLRLQAAALSGSARPPADLPAFPLSRHRRRIQHRLQTAISYRRNVSRIRGPAVRLEAMRTMPSASRP